MAKNMTIDFNDLDDEDISDKTLPEVDIDEIKHQPSAPRKVSFPEMKANAMVGIVGLEPCIAYVSVSPGPNGESESVVGVPGFYDIEKKNFYHLNGKPIEIENFNDAFVEYAEDFLKKLDQE